MLIDVLKSLVPAMLVATVALLVAWRPWRAVGTPLGGAWGTVLACGAGYMAAFVAIIVVSRDAESGAWTVVQWQRWLWIGPVIAAVTVVALIGALARSSAWIQFSVGVLSAVVVLLLLHHGVERGLWAWRAGVAGSVLLLWAMLEPLARVRRGTSFPLAWLLVFVGASIVLMFSGNERFSLLCGSICAALGACVVVALWRRRFTMAGGAIIVLAVLLVGHLELGRAYSHSAVPFGAYWLVAAAPLLLWLGELPIIRHRPAWLAVGVRLIIVALPLGLAVYLAQRAVDTSLYY